MPSQSDYALLTRARRPGAPPALACPRFSSTEQPPAWAAGRLAPPDGRPEALDGQSTGTGRYRGRLSGSLLSIVRSCSAGKRSEVPTPAAVWSYFTNIFQFPKASSALCRTAESSVLTVACLEDTWGKPCFLTGCSVQSVNLGHK